MAQSLGQRLLHALGRAVTDTVRQEVRRRTRGTRATPRPAPRRSTPRDANGPWDGNDLRDERPATRDDREAPPGLPHTVSADGYPGDHVGPVPISYSPEPGPEPDPGEVVWGWVPYEEDHRRGKDRPVLLVGRADGWLLGLPLTSKDHDLDEEQEAREGRFWVDIGAGDWDRRRRPSEARIDRVVRLGPGQVRREGGVLARGRFDEVAAALRDHHG